jgi:two-component system phosphate regulon sensor histidine kinase PhoR
VIQIRDNGAGIPKTLRNKVFERFRRLGLELERERPGTGLGSVYREDIGAATGRESPGP